MFQYQDVVDAFKGLTSVPINPGYSHCQLLDFYAKRLDYQSYDHLRKSLKNLPSNQFGKVSLKLMQKICRSRLPTQDCPYFEFKVLPNNQIGFYSEWIGWDKKGDEVRAPRALDGVSTAKGLRELVNYPIYVVESPKEVTAWRYNWHSTMLIPNDLAREFFPLSFNKSILVEENPPMALVEAKANRYANNIASTD
jgi:hypothetical protein